MIKSITLALISFGLLMNLAFADHKYAAHNENSLGKAIQKAQSQQKDKWQNYIQYQMADESSYDKKPYKNWKSYKKAHQQDRRNFRKKQIADWKKYKNN